MPTLTLQIFVSSPGDVEVERKRAGDVVKHLQEEFANYGADSQKESRCDRLSLF